MTYAFGALLALVRLIITVAFDERPTLKRKDVHGHGSAGISRDKCSALAV
jgi:hypothetical protein